MVWVFDTRTGGFTEPIVVPGTPPGPGTETGAAQITVTAEGDQVWVNDPAGPDAVLIDGTRRATVAKATVRTAGSDRHNPGPPAAGPPDDRAVEVSPPDDEGGPPRRLPEDGPA
ncbi:hypothetical protein [Candidatus Frankia alpina]|uniref:Uncharacterized protein n=1 Tax=Candidatus Frankia alpina TaxID=2699483 RepID=A0A4S5EPF8_9ACTN|nr:hypothetical protein [Candidatus Frankia alpina]THJ74191.1 hypothetical protein E7Y31_12945 [Candidatus Frankia alpina]